MDKSAIIGPPRRPWVGYAAAIAGAVLSEFAVAIPAHSGDLSYEHASWPYPVSHRYQERYPERWHRRHVSDHRYVVNEYYTNYTTPWHRSYPYEYEGWRRHAYACPYEYRCPYGYPGYQGYPGHRGYRSSYGYPGSSWSEAPRPHLGFGGIAQPGPISYEYEVPPRPIYDYEARPRPIYDYEARPRPIYDYETPPRPPIGIPANYYYNDGPFE
jgi:hypothetical protein